MTWELLFALLLLGSLILMLADIASSHRRRLEDLELARAHNGRDLLKVQQRLTELEKP